MDNLKILKSQGRKAYDVLGSIGPYKLYMSSLEALVGPCELPDEVMDALFAILSKDQPGSKAINSQAMHMILEGSPRARSTYFLKKNILQQADIIFGPYLLDGRHWTLFFCHLKKKTVTYIDSLGEQPGQVSKIMQNWSSFAARRGCPGPFTMLRWDHDIQTDSVSCGVYSILFAEMILGGVQGHLKCLSIPLERERLATMLCDELGLKIEEAKTTHTQDPEESVKDADSSASQMTADEPSVEKDADSSASQMATDEPSVEKGFQVESLLKVASSKKATRNFVSVEELQRRSKGPEKFSANLMVTYLRKAKGKKRELESELKEAGIQLSPYSSNTTLCTKLVEEECKGLAKDLAYLTKDIPFGLVGQQLAEQGCAKEDDIRSSLDVIEGVLNENMDRYSLVTHTLGPEVCHVVFDLIRQCLHARTVAKEK